MWQLSTDLPCEVKKCNFSENEEHRYVRARCQSIRGQASVLCSLTSGISIRSLCSTLAHTHCLIISTASVRRQLHEYMKQDAHYHFQKPERGQQTPCTQQLRTWAKPGKAFKLCFLFFFVIYVFIPQTAKLQDSISLDNS